MRPARQRPRRTVLAHVLAACALAGSIAAATPATSISASSASTTVVMSVSPVTTVDGAGCSTGAAVNFGMISLNTGQVTTADCDVIFGSSGGTAQLQVKQTDNAGAAMWSPTTGTLDVAWDGAAAGNGAFAQAVSANRDEAYAAATLPDGNVLAIGTCNVGGFDSLCMTRHLPTGVLDVTFDGPSGTGNGIVTTNVGAGMSDWIGSIALMADGRFLVGGDCWSSSQHNFCIARFNANGSYDLTFDGPSGTGNGKVILGRGAIDDYGESIHLLENGQILFSGFCSNGANDDACIMRLNADGSLDPTFDGPSGGGNGVVLVPIGVGNDDSARVLLQQDGNIVLVGDCVNGGLRAFCAARLTPAAGAFDVTFDGPSGTGNGRFVLPAGAGHVDVFDGAIQEDGRILIAGKCSGATDDFCMARLETTGALDLSFDGPSGTGNGIATLTKVGYEAAYRIIVQDDGMIVLGGECDDKICVTRTTATGALDVAFDGPTGTGNGRIELMTALDGYVGGLAHRSDGDILMAGGCSDGVNEEFCLMMLDGGSTISNYSSTGAGGDTDWASAGTTSMFAACLRSVGGGATTAWMPSDPCAIADGAQWNAIPAAPVTIATTAVAEPDPPDAVARLRFGLRTTATQSPATYVAPITFSILTP